jgi:hypothetical protein
MVEPTGGPFFLCHLSYAVACAGGCRGGGLWDVEGPASALILSTIVTIDLIVARVCSVILAADTALVIIQSVVTAVIDKTEIFA